MAKAVADPNEIRRFAQELKKFNGDIQGNLQVIQARLNSLSDSWRDQEQAKFEEQFEDTTKSLAKFLKASEQHIPFLLRKAQRLDDYLQQR